MENTERLYIISFGDSAHYRISYAGTKEELEKSPQITAIKKELTDFLKEKVGEGSHAGRFATPSIHEVDPVDAGKYAAYPDFSAAAVGDIKKVLLTGVENMLDQKKLDRNAPFDVISD